MKHYNERTTKLAHAIFAERFSDERERVETSGGKWDLIAKSDFLDTCFTLAEKQIADTDERAARERKPRKASKKERTAAKANANATSNARAVMANVERAKAERTAERNAAKVERVNAARLAKVDTDNAPVYDAVTFDNALDTATRAAYVAIRHAYHGTPRAIRNADGELLQYNGTSGGQETMRELLQGFSYCNAAERARYERAAADYENTISKLDESNADTETRKATLAAALETMETAQYEFASNGATDTDDCINAAVLQIVSDIVGGVDNADIFRHAMNATHRHIYGEQTNVSRAERVHTDERGNILSVTERRYVRFNHIYIDALTRTADGELLHDITDVNDTLTRYISGAVASDLLRDIMSALAPQQKRVLAYMVLEYSYAQMAAKMRLTETTVRRHVMAVREKAAAVVAEYATRDTLTTFDSIICRRQAELEIETYERKRKASGKPQTKASKDTHRARYAEKRADELTRRNTCGWVLRDTDAPTWHEWHERTADNETHERFIISAERYTGANAATGTRRNAPHVQKAHRVRYEFVQMQNAAAIIKSGAAYDTAVRGAFSPMAWNDIKGKANAARLADTAHERRHAVKELTRTASRHF